LYLPQGDVLPELELDQVLLSVHYLEAAVRLCMDWGNHSIGSQPNHARPRTEERVLIRRAAKQEEQARKQDNKILDNRDGK
jgi:hypothetical protein